MKTTINTLLATIAITLTASASQTLLVETTIAEHHVKGSDDVLVAPRITVESGEQATLHIGKLEYVVTPTLLDDGAVDLRIVLTDRNGKKADQLAAPRIVTKLGQVAEIQTEQLAFKTKTSLAK